MGGVKGVFDTNILIDYLNGHPPAATELGRHTDKVISRITFMEVLVGVRNTTEETQARTFLGTFRTVDLSLLVVEEAIRLRRTMKIKLPDAIIYATAKIETCNLLTRNTNDFGPACLDVVAPYIV
jgi:predicted nucleic acid-binding protein